MRDELPADVPTFVRLRSGIVNEDFVMVKGGVPGTLKRPLVLRVSLQVHTSRTHLEKVALKFIDTSSNVSRLVAFLCRRGQHLTMLRHLLV